MVILLLTVLAAISLLEALLALRGGARFLALFERLRHVAPAAYAPPATLIVPCRGAEPHLEANLQAYFNLDYPDLQILLVTRDDMDRCTPTLQQVTVRNSARPSKVVFAGRARDRGQKVHNLLHALDHLRTQDEVIVFGDSDVRPGKDWLTYLVGRLENADVGVSTGYRWYVPERGNFASVLRSVWNASIASLLNSDDVPFAWGGAMAIRRRTLDECKVRAYWNHALSDDYAITRAMRDHQKRIAFEPHSLSFTYGDCTLGELFEWSYRQLAITRVYSPGLWRLALASELFGHTVLWGGLVAVLAAVVFPTISLASVAALAVLLGAVLSIRARKGRYRIRALATLFPAQFDQLKPFAAAYSWWTPVSGLLTLWGLVRSAFSRDIAWRGTRYRMLSPTRTIVLDEQ